jgi:hypothetical protein
MKTHLMLWMIEVSIRQIFAEVEDDGDDEPVSIQTQMTPDYSCYSNDQDSDVRSSRLYYRCQMRGPLTLESGPMTG